MNNLLDIVCSKYALKRMDKAGKIRLQHEFCVGENKIIINYYNNLFYVDYMFNVTIFEIYLRDELYNKVPTSKKDMEILYQAMKLLYFTVKKEML